MSNEIKDWVLVPREPDGDMLYAAIDAHIYFDGEDEVDAVWAAMLAAAPTPPAEAQGVDGIDQRARELLAEQYQSSQGARQILSGPWTLEQDRAIRAIAAALSAQPQPNPCKCVDCNGTEPRHSNDCTYMAELHGQPASAPVGVGRLINAAEGAEALIGVMFGRADGSMPDSIRAPLGIPVKVGAIAKELRAALAQQPAAVDGAVLERAAIAVFAADSGSVEAWPNATEREREFCRRIARAALAQQPAAVDEAMVQRGCEALAKRWRGDGPVGIAATEDVRAVLAAALAQPQGVSHE